MSRPRRRPSPPLLVALFGLLPAVTETTRNSRGAPPHHPLHRRFAKSATSRADRAPTSVWDGPQRSPLLTALAPVTLVIACALGLAALAQPAGAQTGGRHADPWTHVMERPLTARQLGLPASAPARTLARAAIRQSAGRLGLRGSAAGVRFALEQTPRNRVPALRQLRFRQTVGGLRVLYSQIDVAVTQRVVSSITATTVPLKTNSLRGRRSISAARAGAIARERIAGARSLLEAQAVAWAGTPGRPRAPRRAFVVQVTSAAQSTGDQTTTICVVVDAASGRVLDTWSGVAARTTKPARPGQARTAQAGSTHLFYIDNAAGGAGIGTLYIRRSMNGNPFTQPSGPIITERFGPSDTGLNGLNNAVKYVTRDHMCFNRDFCGRTHGSNHSFWAPFYVTGRTNGGTRYDPSDERVYMDSNDLDDLDILAHELGHHMDLFYADDRISDTRGVREVEEALADMFAYDAERGSIATLGDPPRVNWAVPEAVKNPIEGAPYPSTMYDGPGGRRDYKCNATDEHYNSTILSHAYYRFVQKVGHDIAGDVLQYIPWYLSARPRFLDVQRGFAQRAGELHGAAVRAAAEAAFREVGIPNQDPPGC
jgi:hypothetical protein